jgi:hypothetical protein
MTEPLQTILDRREVVIKILERDAQDAHDKLANAAAELHCLHARIAELEARVQELGAMARENRSRRIVELEAQLEAVGAGGVEPLCKQVAPQTQAAPDERAAFEKWLRVKPCGAAHDFGWEAWRARAALAATYPTQQGLKLANCKGDKWLTVVYRDIQPGDESRTIGEHPKVSALSWSHALHDRDAALAAKAKQGERP